MKESIKIAKNQVNNIFSSGVYVPFYLCNQLRFQERQESLQLLINKNAQVEDSRLRFSENLKQRYKKLAFCPTYLITRQIFKKIIVEKSYCLITGVSGVGKTYSFILYKIISEMIFQYLHFMRVKHRDDQIPKQLISFVYQIPKIAYWSINLSQPLNAVPINIMSQLYQLESTEQKFHLQKLKSLQKISEFYFNKWGIQLYMLVDQLHCMASIKRKLNFLQEQFKKEKSEDEPQITSNIRDQLKYIQQKKSLIQLQTILRHLVYNFQKVMYLSSVQIEKQILQSFELTDNPGHSPLPISQLEYLQKSNTVEYLLDFSSFLIFNFERKFMEDNLQRLGSKQLSQTQTDAINFFRNYLRENNVLKQIYVGFLEKLNKKMRSLLAEEIMLSYKKNKVPQSIQRIIYQAEKLSEENFYKRISHFLNPLDNQDAAKVRKLFMLQLLSIAKQNTYKIQNDEVKLDNSQAHEGIEIQFTHEMDNALDTSQQFHSNYLFEKVYENYYRCLVPSKILIKVLQKFDYSLWQNLTYFNQPILELIDKTMGGKFIQNLFIKMLSISGTNLTMEYKDLKKKPQRTQRKQFELVNKQLINYQTLSFLNTPKKPMFFNTIPMTNWDRYNRYSFLESFSNYFNLLYKENQHVIKQLKLFLPILKKYQCKANQIFSKGIPSGYIDTRSKLIDFIMIPSFDSQFMKIFAFDVTKKKYSLAQNKLYEFLMQFVHFKDKFSPELISQNFSCKNVQLQYYVALPQIPKQIDWQKIILKSENQIQERIKMFENKVSSLKQSIKIKEEALNNKLLSQKQINQKLKSLRNQLSESQLSLSNSKQALQVFNQIEFDGFQNFCQLSRKAHNEQQRNKILLKKIGVVSCFDDIKISNTQSSKIVMYKKVLEKFKTQIQQSRIQN